MHKIVELLQRPWWCVALLMLAVAAVYWPTALWDGTGFQFVEYDDQQYITENRIVQRGLTPEGVRWAFTTFAASNWHPVTWLSHMLDCTVFGVRAGWHHAMNVLLHAINTALVFLILRRAMRVSAPGGAPGSGELGGGQGFSHWASLFVAALFGMHPMHVESVAWVSERKDVLSTMLGLLAIGCYVRWVQRGSSTDTAHSSMITNARISRVSREMGTPSRGWGGMITVSVFLALSLMAKPMFVTLPCILLLMDWWPLRRPQRGERWITLIVEKIPLFALAFASCVITIMAQRTKGAMISTDAWPLAKRLPTAINAAAAYVWSLTWPTNLACIYPHPIGWEEWRLPLALLTLIALTGFAIAFRRWPAILMGWLLFLGTLAPVIGLVQVGVQWMADRYTYVPAIGFFLMVAGAAAAVGERWGKSSRTPLAILGVSVVVALGVAASRQVWFWRDSESLFRRAVEVVPNNHIAHNSLAATLTKQGDDEGARIHAQATARINPVYLDAMDFTGTLLLKRNRLEAARAHFAMLLQEMPGSAKVRNNYASVLFRLGDHEGAKREWTQLLAATPGNAGARRNLASLHMERGELELAAAEYERSLRDDDHADAYANLGAIRLRQNQIEAARAALQSAIAKNPGAVEARVSMGVVMARLGRWEEAIVQLTEALRLKPDHPQARVLLQAARREQQAVDAP